MRRAPQNQIQWNQVAGVEQVINTRGDFPAVALKRLAGIIGAAVDFVVTVRESAAGQTDGEIRVRPQPVDKTKFGIKIHRGERQPQGQVRAQKIRLVVIIKRVAGKGRVTFKGLRCSQTESDRA